MEGWWGGEVSVVGVGKEGGIGLVAIWGGGGGKRSGRGERGSVAGVWKGGRIGSTPMRGEAGQIWLGGRGSVTGVGGEVTGIENGVGGDGIVFRFVRVEKEKEAQCFGFRRSSSRLLISYSLFFFFSR
ncbi:hypothetical protein TIFTF001_016047 [Ficus carica]|uniref:Uncharacterized protein n=1 Tax=Ficus carica TaxID=3494 RepID=A0AA88A9V8_FICCA|nr:hypothetical protein TIFTF001_016047 [Ficus carica]